MANMTFKASLLPSTDLGYSLGSSTQKWNIYGNLTGNADTATGVLDAGDTTKTITIRYHGPGADATDWIPMQDSGGNLVPVSSVNLANKVREKASGTWGISISGNAATATKLSSTPNNTTTFLRGDNTWSNILGGAFTANGQITANGGLIKITYNGNTITMGSQNASFTHLYNSANIPFIFNNSVLTTTGSLGNGSYPFSNLTLGKADGAGIYYQGSQANYRMIRFIDNTGDTYGNGISIGGGGPTIIGGGESADTMANHNGANGNEIMYIGNDGNIDFYTNLQNGWDSGKHIYMDTNGDFRGSRYIYANYYNASCGAETPSNASYWVYSNSDGFFRKSSLSNLFNLIRDNGGDSRWIKKTGDTMTGNLSFSNSGTGFRGINYGTMGDNDQWRIGGAATASNAGYMEIATADDGNEPIYVRQYTGVFSTIKRTLTLLDANGDTFFPGAIHFNNRGACSIYNGPNDQGGSLGGTLSNVVINSWYGVSFTTTCSGQTYTGKTAFYINCRNGYAGCNRMYGAVWNDYAEYRKDNKEEKSIQQPGRCVKENGDGTLSLTTKRLERGCEIISDTFGFAIGQDEENGYNTPIASSGRVLAYPYESIEEFASHIGYAVCSGPNGTVSIMTDEEEEKYPMRAIGTISEIPDYEEWGTGKVKVNGRVWIRIR